MKLIKGYSYKVKETFARRYGIYQDVICANDCGSSGVYALCLLRNPKMTDDGIQLHMYRPIKFKALV